MFEGGRVDVRVLRVWEASSLGVGSLGWECRCVEELGRKMAVGEGGWCDVDIGWGEWVRV
jgi:hypothetical protein